MNRYNPSGFVYFNVNHPYQNQSPSKKAINTSDFMPFSDTHSPPQGHGNRFSPAYSSSPIKSQRNPGNYNGKHLGRNSFRYHNKSHENSFNNSRRSFNSPILNKSNSYKHTKNTKSFNNSGKKDMSKYLDQTCLEDPWAELEQALSKTEDTEDSSCSSSSSEPTEKPT